MLKQYISDNGARLSSSYVSEHTQHIARWPAGSKLSVLIPVGGEIQCRPALPPCYPATISHENFGLVLAPQPSEQTRRWARVLTSRLRCRCAPLAESNPPRIVRVPGARRPSIAGNMGRAGGMGGRAGGEWAGGGGSPHRQPRPTQSPPPPPRPPRSHRCRPWPTPPPCPPSRDCQVSHYKSHKKRCKPPAKHDEKTIVVDLAADSNPDKFHSINMTMAFSPSGGGIQQRGDYSSMVGGWKI